MPSGSHSSGGSHFGGSSSGGGSHFGGSSNWGSSGRSSGGTSVYFGPRVFVFGGKRYTVQGKTAAGFFAMVLFVILSIFAIFVGVLMNSGGKKSVGIIKSHYAQYQTMCARAANDDDYLTYAVITDSFLNEDCDKYYITYAFPIDSSIAPADLYNKYKDAIYTLDFENEWVTGNSYSVYTLEEVSASEYSIGAVIELALNVENDEITIATDSMPMDYLDMPIERDGEYKVAQSSIKNGIAIIIGGAVMMVIGIAVMVVIFKTIKKMPAEEAAPATSETTQSTQPAAKNVRKCEYCGNIVGDEETKCPNCGAKLS